MNNPWKKVSSRVVYSDPWIRVRVDDVVRPDKSRGTYSVVELKGGIGVVVRDKKERILLVGQFRYAIDQYSWEIPKGAFSSFNGKKDPLQTAMRELQEETGVVATDWTRLAVVNTLIGSTNDIVHIFSAKLSEMGKSEPENTEIITSRWVNEEEFWEMVDQSEVTDATTIAAIALNRRRILAG